MGCNKATCNIFFSVFLNGLAAVIFAIFVTFTILAKIDSPIPIIYYIVIVGIVVSCIALIVAITAGCKRSCVTNGFLAFLDLILGAFFIFFAVICFSQIPNIADSIGFIWEDSTYNETKEKLETFLNCCGHTNVTITEIQCPLNSTTCDDKLLTSIAPSIVGTISVLVGILLLGVLISQIKLACCYKEKARMSSYHINQYSTSSSDTSSLSDSSFSSAQKRNVYMDSDLSPSS
ncbi:hypothetical protein GPJ56_002060 [Histomonas meleagridis]|uniref:uncharacterized protein n=1 Tax=Histomonas meleagridis TaxID=135588 RepID=UPI003559AEF9|nr:hypothetical protein GPJ56_002060 [Histomonas meleagridis]KAH0800871.1 hypothetical protein GO595_006322 [Histomonas meleagridis]